MYITEAKYSDVEDVMDRLSEISLGEMAAVNASCSFHALMRAKLCKDTGFLKVVKDGDTSMAIFGAVKTGNHYQTWFIATEDFFAKKVACTKVVAREMKRVADRLPGAVFEAATRPQHKAYAKWFRTIGFKFVKALDDIVIFRYIGRSAVRKENWIA